MPTVEHRELYLDVAKMPNARVPLCIRPNHYIIINCGVALRADDMTPVFLMGVSGYLTSHILDTVLRQVHNVVTTVRCLRKVGSIKKTYLNVA